MGTHGEELEWASVEMEALLGDLKSCLLATVSASGVPLSSYAPFWMSPERSFYVYVSGMAKHYGHLRKTKVASLSLIEDEGGSDEIFARKRLTVDCSTELIPRNSEEWQRGISGLEERHGEIVSYLKKLVDFDLFRLTASEGRLVLGFGKAYRVSGDGLKDVGFLGAGGHREDTD